MAEKNYFEMLNGINVNDKIEKKNGLSYLSWAFAWGELKKRFPDSTYTIYENKDGWNYFTDGKTCWVKTGVTVQGIEHIEYLPVMDFRNKSIPLEQVTSFEVNKTIQRSLTKAIGRHGVGLYIYAGEDIPSEATESSSDAPVAPKKVNSRPKAEKPTETKPEPTAQPQKSENRAKLKAFCIENNIDQKLIIADCKLSASSTDADFEKAYEYAINLASMPYEV